MKPLTSKGGRDGSEYKINMFDLKCKTDRILKNNKSDKSEKRMIVLMTAILFVTFTFITLIFTGCNEFVVQKNTSGKECEDHNSKEKQKNQDALRNQKKSVDKKDYCVLIGAGEKELKKCKGYKLLVVDAERLSNKSIDILKRNNGKVYSYLNLGSIESFRSDFREFKGIALGKYENWEEELWIDVSKNSWREHLLLKARELKNKGIDGFFVDNTDVYSVYPREEIYKGVLESLKNIKTLNLPIVVNGGDTFMSRAARKDHIENIVYGINQECVFSSIDFSKNKIYKSDDETKKFFKDYMENMKQKGIKIFILEYGRDKKINAEVKAYCSNKKFQYAMSPYIELNKIY